MTNAEIARVLDRIADLLEIDGADGFRVNSYRRAARTIKEAAEPAGELAAQDRLTELPGIGKGTAERIKQYLSTGHIDTLDELEAKMPAGLGSLLDIPSLGPKKVALLYEKFRVASVEDLKRLIDSGALVKLPGFGEASVQKIAEGIAFLERSGGRTPLGQACAVAETFVALVRSIKGVKRVEVAGSLRRGVETIGDIDILCEGTDGKKIVKAFCALPGVKRVLASGETKGSITVELDNGREVQVDLRVVEGASFGAAWQYFTGSKEHNVRLRERAIARKRRLNEYGLYEGERRLAGRREEDIYRKLGLPCIPPELREDRGELEESFDFTGLLTPDDIRGDLHMHTTASDGRCTIEEMALAAKERGYEYIAICDHSRSATIANGLSIERMEAHIEEIRAINRKLPGIEILVGCECDILAGGSLDYPDDLLAKCDLVVASIHTAMGKGGKEKRSPTERTLSAIANPCVTILGHPTGRLINKRAPMEIDIAAIAEAAAENGTFLEINASWQRLDLKDTHAREAIARGAALAINTDAHHTDQLDQMRFGVITARRGAVPKDRVLNTMPLAALKRRLARKRKRS